MRKNIAIVLFCPPRLKTGFPSTLRIVRAIALAREERATLFLCGDKREGSDLPLFESMAVEHGLRSEGLISIALTFNPTAYHLCTQHIRDLLATEQFKQIRELYLVTDNQFTYDEEKVLQQYLPHIKIIVVNAAKEIAKSDTPSAAHAS